MNAETLLARRFGMPCNIPKQTWARSGRRSPSIADQSKR
jgi:hypothetical protein